MQQPPAGPQPSTTLPPPPAGAVTVGYGPPPTNTLALVSLVAGIASYVLVPFVGALVAVITGHMARAQIRQTGESGSGLALAGLILGYVHLALFVLVILVVMLVLGGLGVLFATQAH